MIPFTFLLFNPNILVLADKLISGVLFLLFTLCCCEDVAPVHVPDSTGGEHGDLSSFSVLKKCKKSADEDGEREHTDV